jgi:hypothetical protein
MSSGCTDLDSAGVCEERSVDDVGESAFEDAEGFAGGVAAGAAPVEVVTGAGVVVGLSDGDAV